jgi:flavin-dependent thymidylate synthase
MSDEVVKWVDKAMFAAAPIHFPHEGPSVNLLWITPDPLGAVAAMCRMYEGKPTYKLTDITRDERLHYWEQVQKTHLQAPLEAVKLHFFIEGVDRAFTHQLVRQRTAVYAQESLRFAVKDNIAEETSLPPSIAPLAVTDPRAIKWTEALQGIEEAYTYLVDHGIPAEDARGLLPHSILTRLNYVTDLRNLLDHAGNRLCTQAQFVWRDVFIKLVEELREFDPQFNGNSQRWQCELIANSNVFKPVCFRLGRCPFHADFDRGCTIRTRVDEGRWDEIDTEEFMSDPNAGRTL